MEVFQMKEPYHSTSRVILMCGTAGSGKSTYDQMLEQQGLVKKIEHFYKLNTLESSR